MRILVRNQGLRPVRFRMGFTAIHPSFAHSLSVKPFKSIPVVNRPKQIIISITKRTLQPSSYLPPSRLGTFFTPRLNGSKEAEDAAAGFLLEGITGAVEFEVEAVAAAGGTGIFFFGFFLSCRISRNRCSSCLEAASTRWVNVCRTSVVIRIQEKETYVGNSVNRVFEELRDVELFVRFGNEFGSWEKEVIRSELDLNQSINQRTIFPFEDLRRELRLLYRGKDVKIRHPGEVSRQLDKHCLDLRDLQRRRNRSRRQTS